MGVTVSTHLPIQHRKRHNFIGSEAKGLDIQFSPQFVAQKFCTNVQLVVQYRKKQFGGGPNSYTKYRPQFLIRMFLVHLHGFPNQWKHTCRVTTPSLVLGCRPFSHPVASVLQRSLGGFVSGIFTPLDPVNRYHAKVRLRSHKWVTSPRVTRRSEPFNWA